MMRRCVAVICGALLVPIVTAQVTLGQMDTFQDGTVMGWGGGSLPTNISTGGPFGDGDRFLRITSAFHQRLATYNFTQWAGNYAAARVNVIQVFLKNLGSTELHMRIVLFGTNGDRWTSTKPVILLPGTAWRRVNFLLDESALTRVLGSGTYQATYTSASQLMFRHATDLSSGGTIVDGQLGIDRIHARRLVKIGL